MKLGVHLPQWGPAATRDGVLAVARTAEEVGLDSVWVADHVVFPLASRVEYPYAPDGSTPFGPDDGFLDAFSMLALAAAATERVLLGTSVLVLPLRHPLSVAKTAATLDVLSGGRLILGVGAGWWEEEFRALDAQFSSRGRRFDEQIQILRQAWSTGSVAWAGEFYRFDAVACLPLPVRPGGPPLLIGGQGPRALRRAGTLGDGWHAIGAHAETLLAGREGVVEAARAAGRDPSTLLLTTSTTMPLDPEHAVRRFRRLAELGVAHAVMNVEATTTEDICAALELFAAEALPEIRATATLARESDLVSTRSARHRIMSTPGVGSTGTPVAESPQREGKEG